MSELKDTNNTVDNSPEQVITSALQTLPFENLIGGPLKACVKAQEMATDTTMRFIQEVGFTSNGDGEPQDTVMVSFLFQQQGNVCEIMVPLLSLVPIPFFSLETIDISFQAKLAASSEGELTARFSNADYAGISKYDIQQVMDVKVRASSDSMPAGLAKMLDLFSNTCVQIEEYEAPIAVTGVSLNHTSLELLEGANDTLIATVTPDDAADKEVAWKSSNETIVSVDKSSGKITALKVGTAKITATTVSRKMTATCEVKVNPIVVTGVSLNKPTLTMLEGSTDALIATVAPNNATNKNVSWTTSNNSIVAIDSFGKITALKVGTETITVKTEDGSKTATCQVTVNPIVVTGVSLDKIKTTITEGLTDVLIATVAPNNATNKNVSWASSNDTIAKVDSFGKITAIKAGTATITVKTTDGNKAATCQVTVNPIVIAIKQSTLSIQENSTETLVATITPNDVTNKDVSWISSNTAIAKVDSSGKVTAVKIGTAIITATTVVGNKTATCQVTVIPIAVTGVTLNNGTLSLAMGEKIMLIHTVAPTNAANKNVAWSSSNTNVATVASTGEITAVNAGTAIITVTTTDGAKKAICTVTVAMGEVKINKGATQNFAPGNISSLFKTSVTSLVFGKACLNGTDIKAIMAQSASLESLDLTEATIIEGGEPHYNNYTTKRYEIGDFMFYNMSKLKTVLLPKNTTCIRQIAFNGSPLTSYNIPEGVIHFQNYAFCSSSVTSVTLPASLDAEKCGYGYGALGYNISTINVVSGNSKIKSIDGVVLSTDGKILFFFPRNKGTSYSVPSGVTTLKENCFSITKLTSLTLPSSLTTIESVAIRDTPITSLTIPAGVTHMAFQAIFNISSLKTVTIQATIPPVRTGNYNSSIIDQCNALTDIFVPAESVNAYKTATGWSEHAAKIKAIEKIIKTIDNDIKKIK